MVSGVVSVPFGFGAKKDRGTGFSVLTTGEMEREPKNERVGKGRGRKEGNKRRARMYLGNTKFNFT